MFSLEPGAGVARCHDDSNKLPVLHIAPVVAPPAITEAYLEFSSEVVSMVASFSLSKDLPRKEELRPMHPGSAAPGSSIRRRWRFLTRFFGTGASTFSGSMTSRAAFLKCCYSGRMRCVKRGGRA